ncbi:unnamed protein product [Mytilus coruscus]|uniref:Exonuclease domain-containing protein n=1 Tax=Mytilus coruscus TaxID=42192 RepID=A0A6J8AVJ9_MYTCO|nr:unnamed protein product [Mytilus coruscus]
MCNCPLQLIDTVGERKYGLGSILFIPCSSCSACNSVETGKRSETGAFVVNSKVALGMIHAGIGATHVNNFLGALNVPPVEASFDAGWQKRGTGWNYDSDTGHASMIGTMTGKVIDFSHRSRNCKVCEYHMGRKETVPSHDCSINWQGTSKGMEPDMALEMTHNLKDNGCPIHVLHADNDSTTTARLKVDFKELQKKDDQNHIKKGFSKKLYDLSKTFKELKHPEVIPYLVRCFIYKSLPNVESLSNDALKKEISTLMEKYSTRAGTLQNMGSTQGNENFNQIVASKAPKSRFYGGSSSLSNRLSASVLQKNEGYTWLSKVNEASLLSPGQHTLKIGKRMDKKLKRERERQNTKEFKRRRIQMKKQKKNSEFRSKVKEGTTYENNAEVNEPMPDIQEIPSPLTINESDNFIFFDLETTGLSRNSDITQIAAACGSNTFQRHVIPRTEITQEASTIIGITFSHSTNKIPILVGHNIANFDMLVLENRLKEFHLFSTFSACAKGFIDTLKVSKRVIPKHEVENYKQQTLVKEILQSTYSAHNAKEDVLSLKKLFEVKLQENVSMKMFTI